MMQNSTVVKVIIYFLDLLLSCDSFVVRTKIEFSAGSIGAPSGNCCSVFSCIVIISLIVNQRVAEQISLGAGAEVVFFTVDSVSAVPAVSVFIEIISSFSYFKKFIFGNCLVIILIGPVFPGGNKFS